MSCHELGLPAPHARTPQPRSGKRQPCVRGLPRLMTRALFWACCRLGIVLILYLRASRRRWCAVCNREFGSAQALASHTKSERHRHMARVAARQVPAAALAQCSLGASYAGAWRISRPAVGLARVFCAL